MILQGKTVLITGATSGIGKAIALAMANEGANVVINYTSNDTAAEKLYNSLKTKSNCLTVKADISSESEVTKMFEKIKKEFGKIDILINNAGIFDSQDGPLNLEAFRRVFETNFFAQIDVTSKAKEMMESGKIIFISSIHAKLGNGRPSAIAYSASKAATESYMKNLAKELAPTILVNAVAPGRTLTPMWGKLSDAEKNSLAEGHLTKKWITPEQIADAVVFLAKNDAVCGEVLVVDGGMSLKTLG